MRNFNINVNGVSYAVEVEECGAGSTGVQAAAMPASKAAAPAPQASLGGTQMKAPMTGLIKAIKVKSGDTVKKGDVVIVLEAMKMENDITSPSDGVVTIAVKDGANVESGEVLFTVA